MFWALAENSVLKMGGAMAHRDRVALASAPTVRGRRRAGTGILARHLNITSSRVSPRRSDRAMIRLCQPTAVPRFRPATQCGLPMNTFTVYFVSFILGLILAVWIFFWWLGRRFPDEGPPTVWR